MNGNVYRRACAAMLLTVVTMSSSGCVTSMLWKDHDFRAEGSVEVTTDEYGDPVYTTRGETRVWPTVGKAIATPLTLAVDIVTIGGFIWLFRDRNDDDC